MTRLTGGAVVAAPQRRLALGLAAALGAAFVLPRSAHAQGAEPEFSKAARERLLGGADAAERVRRAAARRALLDEAELQLEAGQAAAALETFERAALMLHASDTELGIVRAHMGLGQYRRALGFGAHTAGAHREQPAGAALYGWLLHVGGQAVVARRLLDAAFEATPGSAPVAQAREQLRTDWPLAGDALLQRPWRAAPFGHGAREARLLPARPGRVAGTAVLLPAGDAALVPAALVPGGGTELWLRDGLGRTVRATVAGPATLPALTLLRLATPLEPLSHRMAAREPFAGSPGSMVEYVPDASGAAAWPLTRQGFFAGQPGLRPVRSLGLDAPPGPRGGPVFDRAGHLAGIAVTEADGRAVLVAAAALPELAAAAPAAPAQVAMPLQPAVAGPLMASLDLSYEQSLRIALQFIVVAG